MQRMCERHGGEACNVSRGIWSTLKDGRAVVGGAAVLCASLVMAGPASAETVFQALAPSETGPAFISCRNPFQTIGIVRKPEATLVYQTSPAGMEWQHRLPPMQSEYPQWYVDPDGAAAVVALSPQAGRVFLVTGQDDPVVMTGAVGAVDFQGNRVLIETASGTQGEDAPSRVRVYRIDSGRLVGDTTFHAEFGDDFRRFSIRLSGDGSFYYYLDSTMRPTAIDAVSGREIEFDWPAREMPIDDMLLYSKDRGYAVAGNKLYALGQGHEWHEVAIPDGTYAQSLVESGDSAIQPVMFPLGGWGVLHSGSGRWLIKKGRGASAIHSRGSVLTVVGLTADSNVVDVYDFSGLKPRLLRSIASRDLVNRSTTCANEHGILNYTDGKFVWHRMP